MRLFKKSIYIFIALLSLGLALVSFVGCDVYMSGLATRLETEVVDGGILAVTG